MRNLQGATFPAESGKTRAEMIWIREAKADRNLETGGRGEEGDIYLRPLGGVATDDGGGADGLLGGEAPRAGGG